MIGSHAHVLQGFEYYNDKLIVYSLGNFIFSQDIDLTALLTMDINEENQMEFGVIPCHTVNGKTEEFSDAEKKSQVYDYLSSISEGVVVDENGRISPR